MLGNMFGKIKSSLAKTRNGIMGSLTSILPFSGPLTDDMLDEIEEVLYEADLGIHAAELLVEALRDRENELKRGEKDAYSIMAETVSGVIDKFGDAGRLTEPTAHPHVILVIGVNGAGKTTTIGKLAMRYHEQGKSVLLAACDTFRAAAIEQLDVWAERANAEIIKAHTGADAASVAFDAVKRAESRGTDVVLIDTAGRLHTSHNLLQELSKIRRVITKADEAYPHETLLVLDATTGQNALSQAETFNRELPVTGIALTKLDGTAKGGIVVSIIDKLGLPIKLIGIGEGIEDLRDFDPQAYAEALFARDTQ